AHAHVGGEGLEVGWGGGGGRGEGGYGPGATPAAAPLLWERALAAGAQPVGREAWNVLRVEAGVVWHGVDVDASTLVMEAPLETAYSLSKGCYIGQEAIAPVTYPGPVNREIVEFRVPDGRSPAPLALA